MNPKPENEKAPSNETPDNQTPTEEPAKPARELGEHDLKQVAGGGWDVPEHIKI